MKMIPNFHLHQILVRAAALGALLCLSLGMTGLPASHAQELIAPTVQSINLVPGWNLVSFYLHPLSTAIADVLASIDGNYDQVYAWDATGESASSANWLRYTPGAFANTLLTLDETEGFWIRMKAAATLDIVGTAPASTGIALSTAAGGWNLVGYPTDQSQVLPDALASNGVKDFSLVYAYDAASPSASPLPLWKHYSPDSPFNSLSELVPGLGYWIKVGSPGTWTVPGPNPGTSAVKLTVEQSPLAIYPPVMIYTATLLVLIPFPATGVTFDFYNISGNKVEHLGSVTTQESQAVLSKQMDPGTYTAIARVVINSAVFLSNAVTYQVH